MAQFFGLFFIIFSIICFTVWLKGEKITFDDIREVVAMDKDSMLDRRIRHLREEVLKLDPELKSEISKPAIPEILNEQAINKVVETYRERPGILKKHILYWNLKYHGDLDAKIVQTFTQRIEAETNLYKSVTGREKARQDLLDIRRSLSIEEREKKIKELRQELEVEELKDKIEKVRRSREKKEKKEPEPRRPEREDYEL